MESIIAIDPGPRSGFAVRLASGKVLTFIRDLTIEGRPHVTLDAIMRDMLDIYFPDKIILEPFEFRKDDIRNREKIEFETAEYVGVVKAHTQKYGIPLILQGASLATSGFWSDKKKIKATGLWDPKATNHQNSHHMVALSHLLYYITFTLNDPTYLNVLKPEDK